MKETIEKFDFRDLFILDLANNHQGSVEHGMTIIERCADVAARNGVRAALKFQFRDLDTFVHPDHVGGSANKHAGRFLSTRLDWDDYRQLLAVVKRRGLVAACTPFDEPSVDKITEMEFDVIKIASCSANDWPLLEKAASVGMPMIVSTGGLTLDQVDDVVSFLEHRGSDFALMHCVSIYPTPDAACNLGNITTFRARYPGRVIGWSTHESPADTVPVGVAAALGAEMFERHVGVATDTIKLNAYSATPEEVDAWIDAWKRVKSLIGSKVRKEELPEEREAIDGLARGVFARGPIEAGVTLKRDDVYFAFPLAPGGLSSGEWRPGIVTHDEIEADAPVVKASVEIPGDPDEKIIKDAVHEVKALLNLARVPLTTEFTVEYSHHYGVRNFRQVGAVLINVINREYCKKVLVQLGGQIHPWHFHKRKEETFLVLYGKMHVEVEDRIRVLQPGDKLLILPGVWHRFWSEEGCVFEEISTTHFANDSVYRDEAINGLTTAQRKTVVDHWGRFQLSDQLREAQVPAR
jgi:sialic acid synthase SpsE/mannose-6-phosphate isomerase-like protein (cupin superfamily)